LVEKKTKTLAGFEPSEQGSPLAGYDVQVDINSVQISPSWQKIVEKAGE